MNALLDDNWALSGGQATKVYQQVLGLEVHRNSEDIDLVVPDKQVEAVATHLAQLTGTMKDVDLRRTKSTVRQVQVKLGDKVATTHIDVLPCSGYGEAGGGRKSVPHYAYHRETEVLRLLPPTQLLNRKIEAANAISGELARKNELDSTEFTTACNDVVALVRIKNAMQSKSGAAGLAHVTPIVPLSPQTQVLVGASDADDMFSLDAAQQSAAPTEAVQSRGRSIFSPSQPAAENAQSTSIMGLFGKR
jgi:hypothetical protein